MLVSVRDSLSSDWPRLWPLLQAMGTAEDEETGLATYDALVEDARWLIVVAESGGDLVGYAAAQDYGPRLRATSAGRFGRLHDVYVVERHRRQDVGRSLMRAVESPSLSGSRETPSVDLHPCRARVDYQPDDHDDSCSHPRT